MRSIVKSLCLLALAAFGADPALEFTTTIRPVLERNCGGCHNPANPKNRIDFLKAQSVKDIEGKRTMWRSVAAQMRNRTMPPMASQLTEEERLRVSAWVDTLLRDTACSAGDYAGAVAPRRLNRREYKNTIRDLFGVDLTVAELFPADESAGAGFDTNGETLYIPPMLLERYMEAAGKVLDRAIVTPPLNHVFADGDVSPPPAGPLANGKPGRMLRPGESVSVKFAVYAEDKYSIRVSVERPREIPFDIQLKVDGAAVGKMNYGRDRNGGPTARGQVVTLERGTHEVEAVMGAEPVHFYRIIVEQTPAEASWEKRALHQRLFGLEPGEAPVDGRKAARQLLARFLPKAFRGPVQAAEVDRFLRLYDQAAERGDPYEERVKLALRGVLVSPRFLFRVEKRTSDAAIVPLDSYDIASRLSYFLWSTMPDEELLGLAARDRLRDEDVLRAQVERMLDDPRSRAFASAFIGRWLGTQEIGGRAAPLLTELQHFYTPEVAADLRQEPVLLFQHILNDNRSLIELLTADYTFLTERLAKYYQVEDKVKGLAGDSFQKVQWPDNRRAGVLGFASVLAMTSHYKAASPVLRGAWVLDTLLGTPVPAPPPDVPPLEKAAKSDKGLTMRQILARHRADATCATCHNLIDPIGFGLENFDWMGRWRDTEANGQPVDASGVMPSGERFNGAAELRQILVQRKDDFVRHLTGKTLGYALGRGIQDRDHCTVQRIGEVLRKENYSARALIREVVLSVPFRNTQGGVEAVPSSQGPKKAPRRLLGEK
jgi:cytochrome c553